jgi:hypothetical protein
MAKIIYSKTENEPIDSEELRQRNSICQDCAFLNGDICEKCGCLYVSLTELKTGKCPIGKWGS